MTNINRRQILKGAVLGTAGTLSASAFSVLAQPSQEQGATDPSQFFREGLVHAIEGHTIIAADTEKLIHRVEITDSTRIWKGVDTTLTAVKPKDFFYARGKSAQDGTFFAETIWLNIVSLAVQIVNIKDGQVDFMDRQGPGVAHIMPHTVMVEGLEPATQDFSRLAIGQYAQMIGTWQPETGDIHVSKFMM
ncbi:MAG: cell wall protein [Pyrinomonadaceae bacterium]